MKIGDRILKLRKERHMSQDELAQKIGISRQTMCRYETGVIEAIPSDKIEKLAKCLCTTPAYLMGWDEQTQSMPVDVSDIESLAGILETLGAKEEADRLRTNKEENRQLITFIKMFSTMSADERLSLISNMIEGK